MENLRSLITPPLTKPKQTANCWQLGENPAKEGTFSDPPPTYGPRSLLSTPETAGLHAGRSTTRDRQSPQGPRGCVCAETNGHPPPLTREWGCPAHPQTPIPTQSSLQHQNEGASVYTMARGSLQEKGRRADFPISPSGGTQMWAWTSEDKVLLLGQEEHFTQEVVSAGCTKQGCTTAA